MMTAAATAAGMRYSLLAYLESADLAALPGSRISLSPVMSAVEATRLAFSTANSRAIQALRSTQLFES
jgi:hypothetical protein